MNLFLYTRLKDMDQDSAHMVAASKVPMLKPAVKKRFGGNAATKKTQRNLLKQQYENFIAPCSEMLDQTFDRLQKLVSRAPRNQNNKNKESLKRSVPVEISTSTTLVSCDGLSRYDWSDQAEGRHNMHSWFLIFSPDSEYPRFNLIQNLV
ncbi:hypothetical protein Tco_0842682 [Tanacetum coccineum]|uniref:Uncharacterized protein n=1 Tax=Tanacetum coccineum TaxID=301880 RepID=A0ABQ5AZY5_9ASTR